MEILEVFIGQPFEKEWSIDYDIFSNDGIDTTIPFIIKKIDGSVVLELELNYGLTIIKFDNEENSKLIMSIYETDMLEEGDYQYSYNMMTLSGKSIINLEGEIVVSGSKIDSLPEIKREVRPWDLLRSKKSDIGERTSPEKQKERLSICGECPRYVKLTSQCLECGCMMKLKTKLAAATCPLGKW